MVRVYKVRLYDGVFKEGNKDYDLVGSILVKRTPMGYVDVLTGFKLSVFKESCIKVNELNENIIKRMGHQPFILREELVQKNLATPEEIDEYVNQYEDSKWKSIYEQMKMFSIAEKVVISNRLKTIYKSKK